MSTAARYCPILRPTFRQALLPLLMGAALVAAVPAEASSHREGPFIATQPQVDGTDFYMFRSYEPGREGYVTLVANYLPLQAPYGGPNYFKLDPNAIYEIHVTNNGGAVENLQTVSPCAVQRRLTSDCGFTCCLTARIAFSSVFVSGSIFRAFISSISSFV